MRVRWLLPMLGFAAATVAAGPCGGEGSPIPATPGAHGPLALWNDDPDGDGIGTYMASGLAGQLSREGNCLYVSVPASKYSPAARLLVAWPASYTTWDDQAQAVRQGSYVVNAGDWLRMGGGGDVTASRVDWVAPPAKECDTSDLFLGAFISAVCTDPPPLTPGREAMVATRAGQPGLPTSTPRTCWERVRY